MTEFRRIKNAPNSKMMLKELVEMGDKIIEKLNGLIIHSNDFQNRYIKYKERHYTLFLSVTKLPKGIFNKRAKILTKRSQIVIDEMKMFVDENLADKDKPKASAALMLSKLLTPYLKCRGIKFEAYLRRIKSLIDICETEKYIQAIELIKGNEYLEQIKIIYSDCLIHQTKCMPHDGRHFRVPSTSTSRKEYIYAYKFLVAVINSIVVYSPSEKALELVDWWNELIETYQKAIEIRKIERTVLRESYDDELKDYNLDLLDDSAIKEEKEFLQDEEPDDN